MEPTFLAVVLIMVLLIGFVLIVLHSLTISAGIRIRADMVKLLEAYDRVVEAKSRQIQNLREELDSLSGRAETAAAAPVPSSQEEELRTAAAIPAAAEYRHAAFGGSYGVIRDSFFLTDGDKQALVDQIAREEHGTPRGEMAAALRQSFSDDTIFRMTLMDPEEQLRLLDTSLNDEDWTLLRDFCEEGQGGEEPFSVTRFCDWLEEIGALESGRIDVRGSDNSVQDGKPRICEGVQILVGSRLYDYSINEREIV